MLVSEARGGLAMIRTLQWQAAVRRTLCALLALGMCAAAPLSWPARGGSWAGILGDGPAQDLSDEDLRLFTEAVQKTLDAPGEPQPVDWSNAATGAGGTLLVLGEAKYKDFEQCRRVRATTHSKKRQGHPSVWTACKDTDGRCRIVRAG
jgi:surface antigen